MAAKRKIDWDTMEADWIAGIKSVSQLSAEYGVSRPAIEKHWLRENVSRCLDAKIKAQAAAMVAAAMVAEKVSLDRIATEREIIKSVAELQAGAILQESAEITRLSEIAEGFEAELSEFPTDVSGAPMDLERRTRILKQLTDTREKIINLRRRNLNINDNSNGNADQPVTTATVTYV
jgi:hypothetical protein